ncbi:ribosome recycling factor [Paucidesulfovibrio gracilis DSM 16080]|uniref:Ribosome-recycling factor n=1 Tax=Paucidesulfovibrio gracilis DSM 16080 TaxID=1121449 RepID=A0A1T4WCC7_9BACT|nr:ribosome recycling factor [Paucidesulfovibrio gracilis]SKA74956.1 ribosome recycling factor [Paucidesulfovibrio gracilis DSM 16080]
MQSLIKDGKKRMDGALSNLEKEFGKLRTGRASTSLVDGIEVLYYGTPTPLNQIASVSIPDSRTITIQPWDKGAFSDVDKAIQKSDLGLTPVNDGKLIRINIPPLTEERRKELVKVAKKYTEDTKVAIRNVRRDLNESVKKMLKDKDTSEDEAHKAQDDIQKLTDDFVAKADDALAAKEKEILEI